MTRVIVRNCIFIRARTEAVWGLVSDLRRWPAWFDLVRAVSDRELELLRGPRVAYRVLAKRDLRTVALETRVRGAVFGLEWRLVAISEGVVVTFELTSRSRLAVIALSGVMGRAGERALSRLKALVEAESAAEDAAPDLSARTVSGM